MDLVVRGGVVVTATSTYQADIGIEGDRIVSIGRSLNAPIVLDATDKYVLPGAIDPHVHMELSLGDITSSDTFATGSIAAACGGVTTLIDFAQSRRGRSLLDTLAERRGLAGTQVAVDYALHVAVLDASPATLAEIPQVIALGCPTFKLYMAYADSWLDDGQLLAVLRAIGEAGGSALVHCENHHVIQELTTRYRAQRKLEPRFHPLTRPALMEGEATARLIDLAQLADCPVTIAHVSCREALRPIQEAQRRGQRVRGETCPQYLGLTEQEYLRPGFQGAKFVMSPPLRTRADQEALWGALARGELHWVATDHCPFLYHGQKTRGLEDFSLIPGGVPGVETRLALLHQWGVGKGKLSLTQWVALCCANPARHLGLANKGDIAVGLDADLVVFDPRRRVTLQARQLHQHVDYTPYEGLEVTGYPQHVLSRGELIVEDGEFVGQAGRGKFVMRKTRG